MNRPDLPSHPLVLAALAAVLLLVPAPRPAAADEFELRHGIDLTLDGLLNERLWHDAVELPTVSIDVPEISGPREASASLRVTTADGRLCVGLDLDEDPGTAMGLGIKISTADAKTAAEAVTIQFRPMELRAPRFTARGPRGEGREVYRVEGGADTSSEGAWSAEVALPLADLVGEDEKASLRVAVTVYTRTPNRVAVWPPGALWKDPSKWAVFKPEDGTWRTNAEVNAKRLAREDEADTRRAKAWLDYLKGTSVPVAATAPPKEVLAHVRGALLDPLDRMLEARPDLRVPLACLRGDIHLRLGQWEQARTHFAKALAGAPGWREAAYGLHVKMARRPFGPPGESVANQRAALAKRMAGPLPADASAFVRDGQALTRALYHYFLGAFDEAIPLFERLVERYPFDAFVANHLGFARKAKSRAGFETRKRREDAGKKLPRAVLMTTKGVIILELYQGDAPNTVNNFVYLGRKKFYDDVAIHRTVPFFVVQTGDAFSRSDDPEKRRLVGTGTPGYSIRSETNDRALLRGVIAMANAGPGTEGSQFFITTGTAVHLEGQQTVFGRILEGQDVADELTEADRVKSVTFEQLDPERAYHPTDASGRPAPEPAAR